MPCVLSRDISEECSYPDESTLRRLLENESFDIKDASYSDKVTLKVLGPEEKAEDLVERVIDMTGGKAACELLESVYYCAGPAGGVNRGTG